MISDRFEVQARLRESRDGLLVRDETRLARTDTRDDAQRVARQLVGHGFTVWIYSVEVGGIRPLYRSIQTLRPESATRLRSLPGAGTGL